MQSGVHRTLYDGPVSVGQLRRLKPDASCHGKGCCKIVLREEEDGEWHIDCGKPYCADCYWYDENAEEGVRALVRALRNEGFNTECSCHHEMFVQMAYSIDGEVKRLHDLVWRILDEEGLPVTFSIQVRHTVVDSRQYTSIDLALPGGSPAGFPDDDGLWPKAGPPRENPAEE